MNDLWIKLKERIDAGDADGCADLLGPLPEEERRVVVPELQELNRQINDESKIFSFDGRRFSLTDDQMKAVAISFLLVAKLSEWIYPAAYPDYVLDRTRKHHWQRGYEGPSASDLMVDLLKRYPRDELRKYGQYRSFDDFVVWPIYHRLYTEGLCDQAVSKQTLEGYFDGFYRMDQEMSVLIKQDRWFLEYGMWELLQLEGTTEKCFSESWKDAFLVLLKEGAIPRKRFVDALFDSIEKDFVTARGRWFLHMLKALDLSLTEKKERVDRYLAMLSSSIPQTVSFAMSEVALIHKQSPMDTTRLITILDPVMTARQKGVVNTAIRMLTDAIKTTPALRSDILKCVAIGFLHESPEIHEKIIQLLEKEAEHLKPDEIEKLVSPYADSVAPALRSRLDQWITVEIVEEESFMPTNRMPQPVRQIQTIEELAELAAHQFENPDDPILLEQVLDGFCRMGATALAEHFPLFEPLKKRVEKHFKTYISSRKTRYHMDYFYSSIFGLGHTKTSRDYASLPEEWRQEALMREAAYNESPQPFYEQRIDLLAFHILAGRQGPLLSTPSWDDGTINFADFIKRISDKNGSITKPDFIQALLRLIPTDPFESTAPFDFLSGDYRLAMDFVVKRSTTLPSDESLKRAAYLASSQYLNEDWVPWVGLQPRYDWNAVKSNNPFLDQLNIRLINKPDRNLIGTLAQYLHFYESDVISMSYIRWHPRWMTIMYPNGSEILYAYGANWAQQLLDFAEVANLPVRWLLHPLLFSTTPFGPMAALYLAMMLASADSAGRQLAGDVVMALVNDGRMNAPLLGGQMARLLHSGLMISGRWASSLGQVITVSKHHASAVVDMIQHSLRGDIAEAPKDVGKYLELLQQVMALAGRTDLQPEVIEYFSKNQRGGQVKKIIQKLIGGET